MTPTDLPTLAASLSEAQRADLTANWDHFCDADYTLMKTDDPEYPANLEAAGYVILDAVSDDDLETPFAWELGIEAGGSVYRLTSLGMELRAFLEGEGQ